MTTPLEAEIAALESTIGALRQAVAASADWNDDQRRRLDSDIIAPLDAGTARLLVSVKQAAQVLSQARRAIRRT